MKKIFLTMLMCAAVGTTFAQTPEEKAAIKEAKSQVSDGIKLRDEVLLLYSANVAEEAKGEKKKQSLIDENAREIKAKSLEAHDLLTKALKSGHVAQKRLFDAHKALDDVSTQLLNPELNLAAAKQTFDTLTFAKSVTGVCDGCYGQIEYANPKDETQKLALANAQLKMPKLMTYYAYLCIFYSETKNLDAAISAYEKYANFAKTYPKVANEEAVKNPQYPVSQFAFNIYYIAYNMKRFDVCEKFYNEALTFPDEGSHNFVVSSRPQIYLQQGDTANWVKALEHMIEAEPNSQNSEVATQNLLAHFSKKGPQEMSDFADRVLSKNPQNKIANYGKGYSLFAQEKYTDALEYFKKSVEIDPEYVDGNNMCGTSLYRQAAENHYKEIDGKKFKTQKEVEEAENRLVKDLYREAVQYFEKCRELAPEQPETWAGPLQTIYRNLGEKEKAAELDAYTK
ncbi:MAG: tetratricopeptide repeat protein [Bacteroidaceae bacterium]|nr:tetratricopeptide repeat protein [Bacteroidaceae bacterium]